MPPRTRTDYVKHGANANGVSKDSSIGQQSQAEHTREKLGIVDPTSHQWKPSKRSFKPRQFAPIEKA